MVNAESLPNKRRKLSKEKYLEKDTEKSIDETPGGGVKETNKVDWDYEDTSSDDDEDISSILEPIMDIVSRLKEQGKEMDNEFSSFSSKIEEHYKKTRPGREEINMKNCLRGFVRNVVSEAFPRFTLTVHLFGSSACGLDSKGDDIDLGVEFVEKNKPSDMDLLSIVANKLRTAKCLTREGEPYRLSVNPILHAKVPIVKVEDPVQNVKCDISTWRKQGGVSNLFAKFCSLDDRVAKFLVFIKYWSKRRGINDGKAMKLTSFSYALLGIKYLQLVGVVPVISSEDDEIPPWKTDNRANVGQLLLGFFELWSKFNYSKLEVSILTTTIEPKDESKFDVRKNQTWMIIADPIERRNNVGRNIRPKTLRELKEELIRGIRCSKEKKFDELLKIRAVRGGWKSSGSISSIFIGQRNGVRPNDRGWDQGNESRRRIRGGWKRRRNW